MIQLFEWFNSLPEPVPIVCRLDYGHGFLHALVCIICIWMYVTNTMIGLTDHSIKTCREHADLPAPVPVVAFIAVMVFLMPLLSPEFSMPASPILPSPTPASDPKKNQPSFRRIPHVRTLIDSNVSGNLKEAGTKSN